ncbi:MAG: hypothetical protein Q9212_001563 [Teloschistes hypoglaucus]
MSANTRAPSLPLLQDGEYYQLLDGGYYQYAADHHNYNDAYYVTTPRTTMMRRSLTLGMLMTMRREAAVMTTSPGVGSTLPPALRSDCLPFPLALKSESRFPMLVSSPCAKNLVNLCLFPLDGEAEN